MRALPIEAFTTRLSSIGMAKPKVSSCLCPCLSRSSTRGPRSGGTAAAAASAARAVARASDAVASAALAVVVAAVVARRRSATSDAIAFWRFAVSAVALRAVAAAAAAVPSRPDGRGGYERGGWYPGVPAWGEMDEEMAELMRENARLLREAEMLFGSDYASLRDEARSLLPLA